MQIKSPSPFSVTFDGVLFKRFWAVVIGYNGVYLHVYLCVTCMWSLLFARVFMCYVHVEFICTCISVLRARGVCYLHVYLCVTCTWSLLFARVFMCYVHVEFICACIYVLRARGIYLHVYLCVTCTWSLLFARVFMRYVHVEFVICT
jgi:hypothetical protein